MDQEKSVTYGQKENYILKKDMILSPCCNFLHMTQVLITDQTINNFLVS